MYVFFSTLRALGLKFGTVICSDQRRNAGQPEDGVHRRGLANPLFDKLLRTFPDDPLLATYLGENCVRAIVGCPRRCCEFFAVPLSEKAGSGIPHFDQVASGSIYYPPHIPKIETIDDLYRTEGSGMWHAMKRYGRRTN